MTDEEIDDVKEHRQDVCGSKEKKLQFQNRVIQDKKEDDQKKTKLVSLDHPPAFGDGNQDDHFKHSVYIKKRKPERKRAITWLSYIITAK